MKAKLATSIVLAMFALAGCRSPGLPTEPPANDAADPDAPSTAWQPRDNPLSTSAFKGVKLGGGGHEHMHHGHHGAKKSDSSEAAKEKEGGTR